MDRGYLGSAAIGALHARGVAIRAKAWSSTNRGRFPKSAFVIQLAEARVTCPAQQTAPIGPGAPTVHFAAAVAYSGLPVHRVRKKAPFIDEAGHRVEPSAANGWKFETFLFDAMPLASQGVVMEVDRALEFAPVKNASGADSPDTARALLRAAGKWGA